MSDVIGFPDTYCPKSERGRGEHRGAYVGHDGKTRCACGAVADVIEVGPDPSTGAAAPREPNPRSQAGIVLGALRKGKVCAFSFYYDAKLTHRLAARVFDLRKMGWEIETHPCTSTDHQHDRPIQAVEYRLTN